MDRDTVRLLVLIVGLVVLAGIYLWGRFKRPPQKIPAVKPGSFAPFRGESKDKPEEAASDDYFEETVRVITPGSGPRKEPGLSGLDFAGESDDDELEPVAQTTEPALETTGSQADDGAPFLIQVSVVAGPGRFFNGADLKQALLDVDLLYGEMGIFHRYDPDLTRTLFSVASLVEPGTFPVDDMTGFECPGIVLFFQTARVADPLGIYDDLVNTSRELAHRLHGIQWDEHRQPLSASKIAHMRNLLKHPMAT
jgi:cell division protein ZipA